MNQTELQFVTFANLIMLTIVPYVLAAQGTMLGGRTGVFNVAQEGMMLVGASVGFLGSYLSGSVADAARARGREQHPQLVPAVPASGFRFR